MARRASPAAVIDTLIKHFDYSTWGSDETSVALKRMGLVIMVPSPQLIDVLDEETVAHICAPGAIDLEKFWKLCPVLP